MLAGTVEAAPPSGLSLPTLERIERKSAILKPSARGCISNAPTINVTQGCAHRCIYCYARAYTNYPGDDRVQLYANLAEKLAAELSRKRRPPSQVYFSSSTDCFGPYVELQCQTHRVMKILLKRGICVSFLTKGRIRLSFYPLFERHAELLDAQIGLITVDERVARMVEPLAATPRERLGNIRRLRRVGVNVGVRIDPMIPGLTDTAAVLTRLFSAVRGCGVRHVAASYLFLRPGIRRRLVRELHPADLRDRVLRAYRGGPRIVHRASPEGLGVVALPAQRRLEGFERVLAIARRYDLNVSICGCKNSDFSLNQQCNLLGIDRREPAPQQLMLFAD